VSAGLVLPDGVAPAEPAGVRTVGAREADRRGVELAELAGRQHGVVSSRQLRALGYSRSAVARMVRRGRLHQMFHGVYAVGHRDVSELGRCLAAVLAGGPGAVLSHGSAAWLWGLVRSGPRPLHVTAPSPRAARRAPGADEIRLHRARHLTPADVAVEQGIPVTAVPRTLLDLAATAPRHRLDRALEQAEELRLFDLGPVEGLLARAGGHRGCRALRLAVAAYRPPRYARSELERRFVAALERAGLPRPVTGWVESGHELDVYWPQHRFAVELDAFETHGTRAAFERDRARDEELALAGVELVRVTAALFEREPDRVVERVARLLRRREGA